MRIAGAIMGRCLGLFLCSRGLVPLAAALLALLAGCLTRRLPAVLSDKPAVSASPYLTREKARSRLHFFVADIEQDKAAASQLRIQRLSVSRLQLGRTLVPKVGFGSGGGADFASWEVCPLESMRACRSGTSIGTEIFVGDLLPGRYTISVKACVHEGRAVKAGELCGPSESAEWSQVASREAEAHALSEELAAKRNELDELGVLLHRIFSEFKEALKRCQLDKAQFSTPADEQLKRVDEDVQAQLENMLNLGPAFMSHALQGLRTDTEGSDELATLLGAALAEDKGQIADANYEPRGLSLSEQGRLDGEAIANYFHRRAAGYQSSGSLLTRLPVREVLVASSGLKETSSLALTDSRDLLTLSREDFQALSKREQYAVLSGALALAGPAAVGEERAVSFASFEAISALFALQRPDHRYACSAYEGAVHSLGAVKMRVRDLKTRLAELKAQLDAL